MKTVCAAFSGTVHGFSKVVTLFASKGIFLRGVKGRRSVCIIQLNDWIGSGRVSHVSLNSSNNELTDVIIIHVLKRNHSSSNSVEFSNTGQISTSHEIALKLLNSTLPFKISLWRPVFKLSRRSYVQQDVCSGDLFPFTSGSCSPRLPYLKFLTSSYIIKVLTSFLFWILSPTHF